MRFTTRFVLSADLLVCVVAVWAGVQLYSATCSRPQDVLLKNKVWDSPHSQSCRFTSEYDFLRQKWDDPPVCLPLNLHDHLHVNSLFRPTWTSHSVLSLNSDEWRLWNVLTQNTYSPGSIHSLLYCNSALPRSDHLTLDTLLFIDLSAVIDHRDIVDVLTAPLLHFTWPIWLSPREPQINTKSPLSVNQTHPDSLLHKHVTAPERVDV